MRISCCIIAYLMGQLSETLDGPSIMSESNAPKEINLGKRKEKIKINSMHADV